MTTSNIKRLRHEMRHLEEISDKYIPHDMYYIVKVTGIDAIEGSAKKWGKNFLTRNVTHQPLCSYIFQSGPNINIILIYSCLENGEEHYIDGSYSKIISQYASLLGRELNIDVVVNIVEFETRTQLLMYFSCLIHQNSRLSMITHSGNKITLSDIRNHTQQELLEKLSESGVDWSSIPEENKYGVFYKLKRRRGNIVIASLSEAFDTRDIKKYSIFIFGS